MKLSVYNAAKITSTDDVQPFIADCVGTGSTPPDVTIKAIVTQIPLNTAVGYQVIVSVASGASAGDYICNLFIGTSSTDKQLSMQIPFTVTG